MATKKEIERAVRAANRRTAAKEKAAAKFSRGLSSAKTAKAPSKSSDSKEPSSTCSCGKTEDHVIARRSTADGKHVLLWSDGSLTWALGYAIRGAMRPRTPAQREKAKTVGWLVLGELELYDSSDVQELVAAARWTADRDGLPGTLRQRFYSKRAKDSLPRPNWTVIAADRDGRPTSRAWVLHRMSPWAGHAVWNDAGRGYELMRRVSGSRSADMSYESTGIQFPSLKQMQAWLAENPPQRARG